MKPLPVNPHKRNTSHPPRRRRRRRRGGGGARATRANRVERGALSGRRRRLGPRGSQRRSGPARPGPWAPVWPPGAPCERRLEQRPGLRNFQSDSLSLRPPPHSPRSLPPLSLPGCWAPLVPQEARETGAGLQGEEAGAGTSPSISQGAQDLTCSPVLLPSPVLRPSLLSAASSPPLTQNSGVG